MRALVAAFSRAGSVLELVIVVSLASMSTLLPGGLQALTCTRCTVLYLGHDADPSHAGEQQRDLALGLTQAGLAVEDLLGLGAGAPTLAGNTSVRQSQPTKSSDGRAGGPPRHEPGCRRRAARCRR